jgi:hypothetical protein
MSIDTQVIDNFLPAEMADFLENTFLGVDFPWYFSPDITYGARVTKEIKNPAMAHQLYTEELGASNFFMSTCSIPFLGSVKVPPSKILRAVAFLQMPNDSSKNITHNHKHIDTTNPHTVLIYYVCDSDGDTFMFSKDKQDEVISKRVTPKKNRALIFDGSIYHASSRPKHFRRCIINFNLVPFNK